MKHSSKIIQSILENPDKNQYDILYALQLLGTSPSQIAIDCKCAREVVYAVIRGDRRSFDIATYIAAKLNTTTTRLWGDAYNYTPRSTRQPLKRVATA